MNRESYLNRRQREMFGRNPRGLGPVGLVVRSYVAKHGAAFFGSVRVGWTRTPPEIALEWWPTIDVNGDFFWLAV